MDTPTASRPSRQPFWTALVAAVATLALAGCSSSDSTAKSTDSTAPASEEGATNDVATSSEVRITFELEPNEIEEIMSNGDQIVVARKVQTPGGQDSMLIWLTLEELMATTEITFDPGDLSVFASNSPLEVGATIEQSGTAAITTGQMATWNNGTFDIASGQPGALTLVAGADGPTVFGLAGTASVNGSRSSSPFTALTLEPEEMAEVTDTGQIVIWVSEVEMSPGLVVGQPSDVALTIDTSTQPNADLTFNNQNQQFELAG